MVTLAPFLLFTALLASPAAVDVGEGPKPAMRPVAWQFEFTFLDPRRIEIQRPGAAQPEVYWYVVYTVSNPSQRAERFFPIFQIVTEDLRVIDTDVAIGLDVFDAIAARHKDLYKYLVPPTKAIGALLSGDDNARESVAIWRGVDLTENDFSIFIGGLSGETLAIVNPTAKPAETGTGDKVIGQSGADPNRPPANIFTLRKTLEIRYTLPGSAEARKHALPEREIVRWVMR